jgi:hypothetical protein
MRNFKNLTIGLLAIAISFIAIPATAQVNTLTSTTLSSAQALTDRVACLTSATGVVIPSTSAVGSTLFIGAGAGAETEVVQGVTSYSTTCFSVLRKVNPTAHVSGASVYLGPNNWFATIDPRVGTGGACTLASLLYYPVINTSTGTVFKCINSQFVSGTGQVTTASPFTAFTTVAAPNSLITAGSVADVNGSEYFSQIYIPTNATLTGACWLNGATVTTDKTIAILFDSAGLVVANTAVAGVADSGASQYQCAAFVATAAVYGPGTYFVGIQRNGTTDNFLTYSTGGAPTNYGTGSQTGTFATIAKITPTVTFTTAKGPLMMVY